MKTKQWISALALAAVMVTTQVACDSKTENKAEEVQDAQEDLNEAQAEGDTSEIRDEQQELDSAKAEYDSTVKDARNN
jgi:Flp pilus assembly protein TadB